MKQVMLKHEDTKSFQMPTESTKGTEKKMGAYIY